MGAVGVRRGIRKARETFIIKEPKKELESISKTNIAELRQQEKALQVAEFQVTGFKPARKAFVSRKRIGGIIVEPKLEQLAKLSKKDLKTLFPKGKVISIEPPVLTRTRAEPFFIERGKVARPVRRGRRVELITLKATPSRVSPLLISRLEGAIRRGSKEVSKLTKKRKELDPLTRESLKQIEKITGLPKGIEVKGITPKKVELQTGEIAVTDIGKLVDKELRIFPKGRRVTRGEITAIQRPVLKTEFEREFGLVERELLAERIGVVDVTFPRVPRRKVLPKTILEKEGDLISISPKVELITVRPRRVAKLRGLVERREFNLPPTSTPSLFKKGVRPKRTARQRLVLERKLGLQSIQKQVAAASLVQKRITRTRVKAPRQILKEASLTTPSLKLREIKALRLFPKERARVVTKTRDRQIPKERLLSKQVPRLTTKQVTKLLGKSIIKQTPRVVTRTTIKQIPRLQVKSITKQIPKLLTKLTLKTPTRTPVRAPPTTPFRTPPFRPLLFKLPKVRARLVKKKKTGYVALYKRKGKFRQINKNPVKKMAALDLGADVVDHSLANTFKIRKTGKEATTSRLKINRGYFGENRFKFRDFKIIKKKKIPLINKFIEKRKARLDTRTEKRKLSAAAYIARLRKRPTQRRLGRIRVRPLSVGIGLGRIPTIKL